MTPFCTCMRGVVLALAFTFTFGPPAAPAQPAATLRPSTLRVGLPRLAFGNLNETDAIAAYSVFIVAAGRRHGYDLKPEVAIYDTLPQLERAVRTGMVQMIVINSWQLLTGELRDAVEVAYVPIANGTTMNRMLLIARRDHGAARLAELRGKSVQILLNANATLGRPWIETLCLEESLMLPTQFFGRVEIVTKPNAAILPVFFGRFDAAVVDEHSFTVACELNPQLRRELVVIAHSAPMLEGLLCLNRIGWDSATHSADLRASLGDLHLDTAGRQILTLFHVEQLAPFQPEQLESVVALAAQHAALLARRSAAGVHAAPSSL